MADLFEAPAQPVVTAPPAGEPRKARNLHKGTEIYKKLEELGAYLMRAISHMQRGMKGIVGEALLFEATEMAELLRQANIARGTDKLPILDELLSRLEKVEYLLSSANAAAVLPNKTYAPSIGITESIGRQAHGLKNKFHAPASTPAT